MLYPVLACAACICFMVPLFSCAPSITINKGNVARITSRLLTAQPPLRFRGTGEVTVAVDGEASSGSFVISKGPGNCLKVDMYSLIGSVVASVRSDSLQGEITLNDKRYSMGFGQTMDSLPFRWGALLRFGEFIRYSACSMPDLSMMRREPDSISGIHGKTAAVWRIDSSEVTVSIGRRVEEVVFDFARFAADSQSRWQMRFSRFRGEIPYSITLIDDERNYFSINYEKIIAE
jgi:hypothetical protein